MTPTLLSKSDVDDYAETILDPAELTRYRQLVKQREHQETPMKPSAGKVKKLREGAKRMMAKSAARNSLVGAVAKAERTALDRIAQLEREVKKSGGGQSSYGSAFELHRLQANVAAYEKIRKAALPDFDDHSDVNAYMRGPAQYGAQASRAATAAATAGAQGPSINRTMLAPRAVLADIRDGVGEPEHLQTSDLPSQVEIHKLEKALADAKSPQDRESLAYQLTRKRLLRGHMLGEI